MSSVAPISVPPEAVPGDDCPARCWSAFVDLDAEVTGLQAWLESVATPMASDAVDSEREDDSSEVRTRWEDFPPAMVAGAIAVLDLRGMSDDELLSAAAAVEKSGASAHAVQARVLAEFARRRPGYLGEKPASPFDEFAGNEVAAVLHVAPRTGSQRLDWAIELASRLPKTLAAMETGQVTASKAKIVSEETLNLGPDVVAAVETRWKPRCLTARRS